MLCVEDVAVSFGGVRALDGVTFELAPGAVTGLIGPNGAGKTTLFNVVMGLQRADSGAVVLEGRGLDRLGPKDRARLGIARTFQRLEVFGSLSVRENVLVAAEVHRSWSGARDPSPREATEELLRRVGLVEHADVPANVVPTGLARLLELARALATQPKVLLLDEPSSGLDSAETAALGSLLLELARSGMAILLVEHDMEFVMRVCAEVHVLNFGRLIAAGTPAEIAANVHVQEAYLGTPPDEAPGSARGG
jgi:branched-chain amino acid transport system ATP-binding protein